MLQYLDQLDRDLLIFLNGIHSPFWDEVMVAITHRFFWIPLYVLIVFLLFKEYKKNVWLVLLIIIAMVITADLFASSFMKPLTERLRPCRDVSINGLLHIVENSCRGKYGFISSHASNSFALAVFLWLLLKNKYKWVSLFFGWAFIVSYSRVYLAVHYPGDVLIGALSGLIWAILFYNLYRYISDKYFSITKN